MWESPLVLPIKLSLNLPIQSRKIEVLASINGVLGGLVGITAGCCVVNVWEALLIGAVGSFLANITDPLLVYWKVGKCTENCDLLKREGVVTHDSQFLETTQLYYAELNY